MSTEFYSLKVLVSLSYVFLILVLLFIETLIPPLTTILGGNVINNYSARSYVGALNLTIS
jgi:hypothetical protein